MAHKENKTGHEFIDQFVTEFESLISELRVLNSQGRPTPERVVDIGRRLQLMSDFFAILAEIPTPAPAVPETEPTLPAGNVVPFRRKSPAGEDERRAM